MPLRRGTDYGLLYAFRRRAISIGDGFGVPACGKPDAKVLNFPIRTYPPDVFLPNDGRSSRFGR